MKGKVRLREVPGATASTGKLSWYPVMYGSPGDLCRVEPDTSLKGLPRALCVIGRVAGGIDFVQGHMVLMLTFFREGELEYGTALVDPRRSDLSVQRPIGIAARSARGVGG
jgi:hypothetical protein